MALNWTTVEKGFFEEIGPKTRNIVQENVLLLLSYDLLYFDFTNVCQKGYFGYVEKCISCFAVIYQSSSNTKYATEMMHIIVCFKKLWKSDLKQALSEPQRNEFDLGK